MRRIWIRTFGRYFNQALSMHRNKCICVCGRRGPINIAKNFKYTRNSIIFGDLWSTVIDVVSMDDDI